MSDANGKPQVTVEPSDIEQAAEWLVTMRSSEASDSERVAFETWLQSSPSHVAACRSVEQTFQRLPMPGSVGGDTLRTILLRPTGRRNFMRQTFGIVLVGGVTAGVVAQQQGALQGFGADVATTTGARRVALLDQGATLHLDARSSADRIENGISLRGGAAAIDRGGRGMAVIESAGVRIEAMEFGRIFATATGDGTTTFGISGGRARVLSPRGGVRMIDATARGNGTIMLAGADGSLIERAAHGGETAWVDGMVEAHDDRLFDVVATLRRYDGGVVILSEAAANLYVSGRFSLDRLGSTFAALEAAAPVAVHRVPDVLTVIRAA